MLNQAALVSDLKSGGTVKRMAVGTSATRSYNSSVATKPMRNLGAFIGRREHECLEKSVKELGEPVPLDGELRLMSSYYTNFSLGMVDKE